MCCAVEYPPLSQKMGMTDRGCLLYALATKKEKVKEKINSLKERKIQAKEDVKTELQEPKTDIQEKAEKCKESTMATEVADNKEKGKKKKWKSVPLTDLGFNISLFPRPTRPERIDPEEEARIIDQIENELEEYDSVVEKYREFDTTETELFEGNCKKNDKLARKDRDRKVRKAGKQVKDKYCTSVKNNKGREKLFIHHRLFKLINLEVQRLTHFLPSRSNYRTIDFKSNKSSDETKSRLKPYAPIPSNHRPAPVQNLRFALQNTNAASHFDSSLVNVLINLQHRDLTPEDYELLLRLDESVAPKTVDKSLLDNFKSDIVDDSCSGDICPVCMDAYEIGQNRKFLPCNHVFHAKCIEMWLENSSRNCPIDNLPVDEPS
ncbi:uncharacterized protein LOC123554566 [Mercenaria mercenaria]|uniref:uncharacterized protein LOC123554566 n=1 Tax=Mercenaria mercenaria TaxID=6596 RepID=UPI001E1D5BFC|nr:uncharacterized protein LOC123554566 [Mercenaria mercenaria]